MERKGEASSSPFCSSSPSSPFISSSVAMANTWSLQEDTPSSNIKDVAAAGEVRDEMLNTWMIHDELAQYDNDDDDDDDDDDHHHHDYLNCLFELKEPRCFTLPPVASPPVVLPSPSPSVNFAQFAGPVARAKSVSETAGIGCGQLKLKNLHEHPNGVVSDLSMSALSLTDSNISGLAHQDHHHLQIWPPYVGKELPNSTNSASCSEKTHHKSVVNPLPVVLEVGHKCSLGPNIGKNKRTRVPEQHNKSEKRRRDKINEKMRTLQQLIPNSGKTNKSSILDEAIEYIKYLQFQIQYMLMHSGMGPMPVMLFTGMQAPTPYYQLPYVKEMGMGPGLSGMDMEMRSGSTIGHPFSHIETMQTIQGHRITPS